MGIFVYTTNLSSVYEFDVDAGDCGDDSGTEQVG
jgi:hypothetical protein